MLKNFLLITALALTSATFTGCKTSDCGDCCTAKGEWIDLFGGQNISALRGYNSDSFPSASWKVENGMLHAIPGKGGVDLITKDEYENFELDLEWKVSPGGNSGVIYMVKEISDKAWHTGPEMQILDDKGHGDGKKPTTSAGALYAMIAPSADKELKPVGEFNVAKLIKKDGHVEHWLNGKKVVEYQWGSPEIAALIQQSKFKTHPDFMKFNSGHIVFQHHGQEVWLRNIRIKKL